MAEAQYAEKSAGSSSLTVLRVKTFAVCSVLMGSAHLALARAASLDIPPIRILPFLYFLELPRSISSFGIAHYERWVSAIGLVVATILALALCSIASARHHWQFRLAHLFAACVSVKSVGQLATGGYVDYFQLRVGSFWSPAFSLPGAIIWLIIAALYPFALVKFFRLAREPAEGRASPGRLSDPFYNTRYALRAIVVLIALAILVKAIALGVEDVVDGVLTSLIGLLIVRFFWRLIPNRRIDVVFLRGFSGDRAANRRLRSLRRALGRGVRVTGVTNPRESRRLITLPLWLYFPIFFAVGDYSSANAFRHNVFLVGNWRDGIDEALATAREAVFDCGVVTANLAWELQRAFRTLGPEAMYLVYGVGSTIEGTARLLESHGAGTGILQGIPADRWFASDRIGDLAKVLVGDLSPKE